MKLFGIAWELALIFALLGALLVAAPAIVLWLAYKHRKAKRRLRLAGPSNLACPVCSMPHSPNMRVYHDEDPDYEPDDDGRGEVPGA